MAGKFELKKSKNDKYFFSLLAGNGQKILASEMYETKASATGGIESVKKNAPDDSRLVRVDPPRDAGPRTVRPKDFDVVVAVDLAARDLEGLRLPQHRVVRPLTRLLALHLRGEVGQRQHYLVHRVVERALAVFQVEEHTDTRVHDLLESISRLDLLAPQPRLL